jgi:hypothetical protein
MSTPNWDFASHIARQVGKTTAICEAAKKINATVVAGSSDDAKRIEREHGVKSVSYAIDKSKMLGRRGPILFDTYAVSRICEDYERRLIKLEAVAKAAKNEAITWNEELCNSKEYDEMMAARKALDDALKALEE